VSWLIRSKIIRYIALPLIALVLLVIVGGGWYFASVLEEDGLRVDNEPDEFSLTVDAISDDTITLRQPDSDPSEALLVSAVWGVTDGDSYGQLGDILSESPTLVTREFTPLVRVFEIGDKVRLDRSSFPGDPEMAYGLDYDEVSIPAPLGDIGGWHVAAESDLWAILVHGRTSNRDAFLKLLDDFDRLEINTLTIDYRNDIDAPPSESGYYDFGTTEWEDVEAAVLYALKNGAGDILLVGSSMGGGIVTNYQLKSDLSDRTVGLILDAPMLDFGKTVDKGAEERSVPTPITAAAKFFATMRFGIDWSALDFLSKAEDISVPVLLIHGEDDETVPMETSIELAEAIPDQVELHTFAGVGHVASWNDDPDRYEALVEQFVNRIRQP